jgi:hypothetical protein
MVLLLGGTCVPLDRSGARNLDMMAVANLHACDAFHLAFLILRRNSALFLLATISGDYLYISKYCGKILAS